MTSINSNLSSYYSLANALTGQQNGSSSDNSLSSGSTSGTSITQSLIDALDQASGAGTQNNSDSAYSLSLSPEAQQLLGGSSSSSSSSFTLTDAQQKTVEGILEQFANQPMTQATYDQIQQALQKAGLSANQLMAQDEINSVSPSTLIDDLNGNTNTSLINPATVVSNEMSKADNYMQSIVQEWQSLSNAATSSGSGTAQS